MLNPFNISAARVGGIRFLRIGRLQFSFCVTRGEYRPLKNSRTARRERAAFLAAVARDRAYNERLASAAARGDWQAIVTSNSGPDLLPVTVRPDLLPLPADLSKRAVAAIAGRAFAADCDALIAEMDATLASMRAERTA